jgi:hypothetical protein
MTTHRPEERRRRLVQADLARLKHVLEATG